MADAYDFEEAGLDPAELQGLVKNLKAAKGKDSYVKLLKKLGDALERAPQDVERLGRSRQDVANVLASSKVLNHQDKDVKLYAARCLMQLLRVYAPESPYDDETLHDVFRLLTWCFNRLHQAQAPTFNLCHSILEVTVQTKSYLMLLDLGNDELTTDAFTALLENVNDDNLEALEVHVVEVLAGMLEEGEELSSSLLQLLLLRLLPPQKDDNPAAYRVAQRVVVRVQRALQAPVQKLLVGMLETPAGLPQELKGQAHNLIYEVYSVAPQLLLMVLPQLQGELHDKEEGKRLQAVATIVQLLALPGSTFAQDYPEMLQELLSRLNDQKQSVRLAVLAACGELARAAGDAKARLAVVEGMAGKVIDTDEKVRVAALKALCGVWCEQPALLAARPAHVETCLLRLRDKRKGVQREAAAALLQLFQRCAELSAKGRLPGDLPLDSWARIPGKLLGFANVDPVLREFCLDGGMRGGLMPGGLAAGAAAQLWVDVYSCCTPAEQEGTLKMVAHKGQLQTSLLGLLHLRRQLSGREAQDRGPIEQRLQVAVATLARMAPDLARARDLLQKLLEAKDNHVFTQLMIAVGYSSSPEDSSKALKDALQRLGSKSAVGEMVALLCARAAPTLLPPAHLRALLQSAADAGDDARPELLALLTRTGKAAPSLLVPLIPTICSLLTSPSALVATLAVALLAKSSQLYRKSQAMPGAADFSAATAPAMAKLHSMCQTAAPRAAKLAALAVAGFCSSADVQQQLGKLCGRLVKVLRAKDIHSPSVLSVLAALSSIGRVAPLVYQAHVQGVAQFVLQEYCGAALQPARADVGEGWLKGRALKSLARSLVPDADTAQQPHPYLEAAEQLLQAVAPLLDPDEDTGMLQDETDEVQRAQLRLAAATSVLRLARRHDRRISPTTYVAACLTVQDPAAANRSEFAHKLRSMLRHLAPRPYTHHLAAKYAAALALSAMDPVEENRLAGRKALAEFVAARRKAARDAVVNTSSATSGGGSLLQEHPEFMSPYLVYLLAHHPDCPGGGGQSQEEQQQQQQQQEEEEEVWQPFQLMMQCGVEALLVPLPLQQQQQEEPLAMLPPLLKLLRSIRRTRDADTGAAADQQLWAMADLGIAVARAVAARVAKGKAVAEEYPGEAALPVQLYRAPAEDPLARKPEGAWLPRGYTVQLAPPMYGGKAQQQQQQANGGPAGEGRRRTKRARAAAAAGSSEEELSDEDEEAAAAGPGSAGAKRKRAAAAAAGSAQKRGRGRAAAAPAARKRSGRGKQKAEESEEEDELSGGEEVGGQSQQEEEEVLPVSKRAAAARASGGKQQPAAKAAPTPPAGPKPAAAAAAAKPMPPSHKARPAAKPVAAKRAGPASPMSAAQAVQLGHEEAAAAATSPDPYDLPADKGEQQQQQQQQQQRGAAKRQAASPDASAEPKQKQRRPGARDQAAAAKASKAGGAAKGRGSKAAAAAAVQEDEEADEGAAAAAPSSRAAHQQQRASAGAADRRSKPAAAAEAAARDQQKRKQQQQQGSSSEEDAAPAASKRRGRPAAAKAAAAAVLGLPSSPSSAGDQTQSPSLQLPSPPKPRPAAAAAGRAGRRR